MKMGIRLLTIISIVGEAMGMVMGVRDFGNSEGMGMKVRNRCDGKRFKG
jgi:hypothetical protein